jgi:hypothetical protein
MIGFVLLGGEYLDGKSGDLRIDPLEPDVFVARDFELRWSTRASCIGRSIDMPCRTNAAEQAAWDYCRG